MGPKPPSVRWPHATSPGAATSTEDRGPGAAPRREASFQVGGCARSSCGRRRDRSEPSRGVKKACHQAVLLSTQDKVTQCESFLERARKREAGAKELVLQAQKELAQLSAEVVEGEQRLAFEPSWSAPNMSAEVERLRVLVEQLSKEKEDGRPEVETHLQARRFVHSTDPAVEVQKVSIELMAMQRERDALKAALEAQRNCVDTPGTASPGTRMSVLIDDAAKRRCLEGS